MRINKFIALSSGLSRRAADQAIAQGRVTVNGAAATAGQEVDPTDIVLLDNKPQKTPDTTQTILLNKPVGYVVSREGQGARTIYDLLPQQYHSLKPVGRLDKNSSGLLLLTNNGDLANRLTHPSFQKTKLYEVELDKSLNPLHYRTINTEGVQLEDGLSRLKLQRLRPGTDTSWLVTMQEGRNRQIRRTFAALGYHVVKLHRTHFGDYVLGPNLPLGHFTLAD